jgi:hypothetical protein
MARETVNTNGHAFAAAAQHRDFAGSRQGKIMYRPQNLKLAPANSPIKSQLALRAIA